MATATTMTKVLESLKGVRVISALPIISESRPTLMITPEHGNDITAIKALMRLIAKCLFQSNLAPCPVAWQKLTIGDEWMLRTVVENISIDLMTRLPATKEATIDV